jgi:hypothetical protein
LTCGTEPDLVRFPAVCPGWATTWHPTGGFLDAWRQARTPVEVADATRQNRPLPRECGSMRRIRSPTPCQMSGVPPIRRGHSMPKHNAEVSLVPSC